MATIKVTVKDRLGFTKESRSIKVDSLEFRNLMHNLYDSLDIARMTKNRILDGLQVNHITRSHGELIKVTMERIFSGI